MFREQALSYPRKVTYNFSQWGDEEPVSIIIEGVCYYGALKQMYKKSPYQVVLSEKVEAGTSQRITPRVVEVSDLGELHFLHQHGH